MPLDNKTKKLIRQSDRENRAAQRDLERDRRQLNNDEKRLEAEIKKFAKQGDRQACVILAKQLLQVRNQRQRTFAYGSTLSSINSQQKIAVSTMKMGETMGSTAQIMKKMNAKMDPAAMAKTMHEFEQANARMNTSEEMMDETISSMFDNEDAESDAVVQKVLDEISVDISAKLADTPSASHSRPQISKDKEAEDIERLLAELRDG